MANIEAKAAENLPGGSPGLFVASRAKLYVILGVYCISRKIGSNPLVASSAEIKMNGERFFDMHQRHVDKV